MKVGVALGGGGAKGLAHIPMLEVLDEFGIHPHMIAGTSIGAIIGVLYASGMYAAELRARIGTLTATPRTLKEAFRARELPGWLDVIGLDIGRGRLFQVDEFLTHLEEEVGASNLEDLRIPVRVVASDFWDRRQVIFDSGPIAHAVAASFALPGIFRPVVHEGRVLVDGGSTNPVPYDLLEDECDVVIAIDVLGKKRPNPKLLPSYSEVLFNTFQIAQRSILEAKMKASPPTIYIAPEIHDVRALEFHKAESVYEQARPARAQLAHELRNLLGQRTVKP
jgi:NTE family protein